RNFFRSLRPDFFLSRVLLARESSQARLLLAHACPPSLSLVLFPSRDLSSPPVPAPPRRFPICVCAGGGRSPRPCCTCCAWLPPPACGSAVPCCCCYVPRCFVERHGSERKPTVVESEDGGEAPPKRLPNLFVEFDRLCSSSSQGPDKGKSAPVPSQGYVAQVCIHNATEIGEERVRTNKVLKKIDERHQKIFTKLNPTPPTSPLVDDDEVPPMAHFDDPFVFYENMEIKCAEEMNEGNDEAVVDDEENGNTTDEDMDEDYCGGTALLNPD
ncbi:hypothetical protein U9M48_019098, partial [Paspalum notatum var. saurae]